MIPNEGIGIGMGINGTQHISGNPKIKPSPLLAAGNIATMVMISIL
jgi:hypothetical protein